MKQRGFMGNFWRILYPILIFEGASILASSVVMTALMFLHFESYLPLMQELDMQGLMTKLTEDTYAHYTVISVITYAVCIPFFLLFMRRDRRERVRAGVPAYETVGAGYYAAAFFLGICACLALNNLLIFSRLTELIGDGFDEVAELIYQGPLWVEILVTGIIGPVAEEMLFRGLIYRRLRDYQRELPAVLFSAMVFGIVHMNLLQFVYAFLIGIVLAYACERFKSLLAPILIHVGANVTSVILTETRELDFLYENDTYFLLLTAAMILGFLGLAYLLLVKVDPKPLAAEGCLPEAAPAEDRTYYQTKE